MVTANEYDPVRGFKFEVVIGTTSIGFQKVSGLKTASDVVEYREGNMPIHKRKLPGLTNYDPIQLQRGISANDEILKWRAQVAMYEDENAQHDGVVYDEFRRTITIKLFDKGDKNAGEGVRSWKVMRAWPSELTSNDLNAEGSEVVIENLVLQHEGLEYYVKGEKMKASGGGSASVAPSEPQ